MDIRYLGQFAALATAISWSITSLSFEAAGKRVGSLPVNIIRLSIAFTFFALYSLATTGAPIPLHADAHVWLWMSFSGLVGFVLGDLFLFQAFIDVGARVAMLIYASVPVLTAVLDWLILGQRLTLLQLVAMGLTVSGIATVTATLGRAHQPVPGRRPVRGAWFALLGAFGQAGGLVLARYGAPTFNPFAATQVRVIAAIVGFVVVVSARRGWPAVARALRHRGAMAFMTIGSIFGPFVGVTLSLFAAQRAGAGVAATIIATVPILLIPITVVVFRERVTVREVVGACIAVGGVALLFL